MIRQIYYQLFKSDPLLLNQVANRLSSQGCVESNPHLIHFKNRGCAGHRTHDPLVIRYDDHLANEATPVNYFRYQLHLHRVYSNKGFPQISIRLPSAPLN